MLLVQQLCCSLTLFSLTATFNTTKDPNIFRKAISKDSMVLTAINLESGAESFNFIQQGEQSFDLIILNVGTHEQETTN